MARRLENRRLPRESSGGGVVVIVHSFEFPWPTEALITSVLDAAKMRLTGDLPQRGAVMIFLLLAVNTHAQSYPLLL